MKQLAGFYTPLFRVSARKVCYKKPFNTPAIHRACFYRPFFLPTPAPCGIVPCDAPFIVRTTYLANYFLERVTLFVTFVLENMIRSFSHKGLRAFFETGDARLIHPHHVDKVNDILTLLHQSESASDMNIPGLRLHRLVGEYRGFWSVKIDGKWRIIFKFIDKNAYDVDYLDYHQ